MFIYSVIFTDVGPWEISFWQRFFCHYNVHRPPTSNLPVLGSNMYSIPIGCLSQEKNIRTCLSLYQKKYDRIKNIRFIFNLKGGINNML